MASFTFQLQTLVLVFFSSLCFSTLGFLEQKYIGNNVQDTRNGHLQLDRFGNELSEAYPMEVNGLGAMAEGDGGDAPVLAGTSLGEVPDSWGPEDYSAQSPDASVSGNAVLLEKRYFMRGYNSPSCYGLNARCNPLAPQTTGCTGACTWRTVKACRRLRGRGFRCIQVKPRRG